MALLAAAKLPGFKPAAQDKDGHTPNECFLRCRDVYCAVAREPFKAEKRAWISLLSSARGHGEVIGEVFDDDDETVVDDDFSTKRRDSFVTSESGDGSDSDDFVDAEA